jgi:hypothetical protein
MPKKKPTITLNPRKLLHIYCEGEKTEPNYLNSYIQANFPGNSGRKVIVVEETKKNTPRQLVDVATAAKKSDRNIDDDEYWVVYDRESTSKYSDELHAKASKKALDNGVHIALSNVCFELWVLLHFKANTASFDCCVDLMENSSLMGEFKKIGIKYEKSGTLIFDKLTKEMIVDARVRAKKMNQTTLNSAPKNVIQPHKLNPYTDVHLLLDAIDKFKT